MPAFLVGSELEKARHKFFNYAVKNLKETIVDNRRDDFFSNLIFAAIVNLDFWVHFEIIYDGRSVQTIIRTQKLHPTGLIEIGVHQGRLHKTKRYSEQN